MKDDTLIKTSIAGVALIPLCCLALTMAPLLGLSVWLGWAGYLLLPALAAPVAIAAAGIFYLRGRSGAHSACCESETSKPHGMQR
jgi:hypothetical protein